jgi:hypothetical protein
MNIIRRNIGSKNQIKNGQVYKNGLLRRKVRSDMKYLEFTDGKTGKKVKKPYYAVTDWGPNVKDELKKVFLDDWGDWKLIAEHKVLKITESQLKKIMESENTEKTAYPNGEMVDFDDCTKLNNNKVAQDGGCSQGAIDNVVKTTKTKGSVVSEDFSANVGAGSVYAVEVKDNGNKIILTQDNGQTVVVHKDDVADLSRLLNSIQ